MQMRVRGRQLYRADDTDVPLCEVRRRGAPTGVRRPIPPSGCKAQREKMEERTEQLEEMKEGGKARRMEQIERIEQMR